MLAIEIRALRSRGSRDFFPLVANQKKQREITSLCLLGEQLPDPE